jgi:hypothetical protein
MRKNRKPATPPKPPLLVADILVHADAFHARWGRWPNRRSGSIDGTNETWCGVDGALFHGHRSLPRGSSLIKLLAQYRGYRHRNYLPKLSLKRILALADAHRARTGEWPTSYSGPVEGAPGETWAAINLALMRGTRGLPGGSSLADLLAQKRGRRNHSHPPDLALDQIVALAEAHHTLFGTWPTRHSGPVGTTGETWEGIDKALREGSRGLPAGWSLYRLLEKRGKFSGCCTPYRQRRPRYEQKVVGGFAQP